MSGKANWIFFWQSPLCCQSRSPSSEQAAKAAPAPAAPGDPLHLKKVARTIRRAPTFPIKHCRVRGILLRAHVVLPSNGIPKHPERDQSPLTALKGVNKPYSGGGQNKKKKERKGKI